ncbi:MAG TPA: TIGR03546 family protein [Alkalispirochaeta sp.]|nr:TIGR03546 family protein [Alkalispirochaeta sp.]
MIITWIARLIASLNANRRPGEIAAGIAMGVWLALLPVGNLLWVSLFVITVFLKLNLAIELLILAVLSPLAVLADGQLHLVGSAILTAEALEGFFTTLYNIPLVPFTRFNNTVVMGALVAGAVLWIPVFLIGRVLVRVYRRSIHPRLAESKIVKAVHRIPGVSRLISLTKRFQNVYSVVS